MDDLAAIAYRLVCEAIPVVQVFDGLPAERLEDREEIHVIFTAAVPVAAPVAVSAREFGEILDFQIRTVVRTDLTYDDRTAADKAREIAMQVRDYLVRRKLQPHGSLIDHKLESVIDSQNSMLSYETVVEVSQYKARV